MGLAPLQPGQAHVQPGLICLDRAVPYQNGVMARALQMSMGSRLGSCDPLAFTVRPRDLPVKRRREFQSNIWPAERSEEHTSELQSLMRISYAVFCLQKKKMNNNATITC